MVFGYGPMMPLAVAAVGAWFGPGAWPALAEWLGVIWGALILAFVAGVRRGFGFGDPRASTKVEIVTMMVYFVPAGLALILAGLERQGAALACLLAGYVCVPVLDRRAALRGDAPAHFARLRPPQMAIAVIAVAALLLHRVAGA